MILKIEINQPLLFAKSAHNSKTNRNRCRGHQRNKAAVKAYDCGFLIPSHPVTDICANFAKTTVYGKEQHTKSHHLHQRQGGSTTLAVNKC